MLFFIAAANQLRYSSNELYQLWTNCVRPRPLKLHRDILLRRSKYIHRGSRRNHSCDGGIAGTVCCIWYAGSRRPRSSGQRVDHSVLTPLAKSTVYTHATCHKVVLYNIRSITNKGHLVNDFITDNKLDYLCLTKTWQQQNDFLHLNSAALSLDSRQF